MIDLLIVHASPVITFAAKSAALTGSDLNTPELIVDGAIAIQDEKIIDIGKSDILQKKYQQVKKTINANHQLVIPGFVDCHTHLVYAGSREHEMMQRLQGATYLEILKSGGGIHSTVKAVRNANEQELLELALPRIQQIIQHGTTTVEIKTGYALDIKNEIKMLKVIDQLKSFVDVDIVPTYLGAHTIPKDIPREKYIDMMIREGLPEAKNYCDYCDIFCEDGAYTLSETEKILKAALALGFKLKIHAGQFNDLKAAGLAAELGAISADHLENVSIEQLKQMKKSQTACVLMPGVPFFLLSEQYPDARRMIEQSNIIALATDFNPGSCPTFSMQMIIALACFKMQLTAREALSAATINSAFALELSDKIGSLEIGKQGDIIILAVDNPEKIPYYFGTNLVKQVIKKGKIVY
ncbi:MAG: imidazolonepropionase [Spirochaetes bacterium]|nr:imidazolonepropionase [Spirochaetota bacterium]